MNAHRIAWLVINVLLASHEVCAHGPSGIVVDQEGRVYFLKFRRGASDENSQLWRLGEDGKVSNIPIVLKGRMPVRPHRLAIDRAGNLYLRGRLGLWKVTPKGRVSEITGWDVKIQIGKTDKGIRTENSRIFWDTPLAVDPKGNIYCVEDYRGIRPRRTRILSINPQGDVRIVAEYKDVLGILGMAWGTDGAIYFTEGGTRIRRVTPKGEVTTLAGGMDRGFADGQGSEAQFNVATGLGVDGKGNVYVADRRNRRIRKVTPKGVVTTVAGTGVKGSADGPALGASFNEPSGIAVGPNSEIYVLDYLRVRMLSQDGQVTTIVATRFFLRR